MKEKRPIDRKRDSAGSIQIGSAEGSVESFLNIGDLLYVVTGESIHRVALADEIDPERVNISIPNTTQLIMPYGANDEIVGRVILTARELLKSGWLIDSVDSATILKCAFSAQIEMCAALDIATEVNSKIEKAAVLFSSEKQEGNGLKLPTVQNIATDSKSYFQKIDHFLNLLLEMAKSFYGAQATKGRFESLLNLVTERYGPDDNFAKFLTDYSPLFEFIRLTRNAIEHPDSEKMVTFLDFHIDPAQAALASPELHIIHPKLRETRASIGPLMNTTIEHLIDTFESFLALLCIHHLRKVSGLEISIVRLPEDLRPSKHVQLGYDVRTSGATAAP